MDNIQALEEFLKQVERRAFRMALFALRNEEDALDAVQNAMMKLASHYHTHNAAEWPLLFQRILQNCLRDIMRRNKMRNFWNQPFAPFLSDSTGDESDALEIIQASAAISSGQPSTFPAPPDALSQAQVLKLIEAELVKLPVRQREAFLMRYWEGLNTAATAAAMGCSEGSVKQHCSRATKTLAAALRLIGIRP